MFYTRVTLLAQNIMVLQVVLIWAEEHVVYCYALQFVITSTQTATICVFCRLSCVLHVLINVVEDFINNETVETPCISVEEEVKVDTLRIAKEIMEYFSEQRKAFVLVSLSCILTLSWFGLWAIVTQVFYNLDWSLHIVKNWSFTSELCGKINLFSLSDIDLVWTVLQIRLLGH